MKKIALAVIVLLSLALFGCNGKYSPPDLTGIEQKEVVVRKIIEKDGDWECAQGLGLTDEYFYYAGHNDRKGKQADIHVIDRATGKEVDCFREKGALHSAEVCVDRRRGTLTACSGGDGRKPYLYELDIRTGEKLNEWDFGGRGENGGGLHCFTDDGTLVFFTSSGDGAKIAFDVVTLSYDGSGAYEHHASYSFSATDLGVPQGLDWYDGYLYYLADAGKRVENDPHYVYKIALEEGTVKIVCAYLFAFSEETEGLCIDKDGTVYMGAADECIYRFEKKIAEW